MCFTGKNDAFGLPKLTALTKILCNQGCIQDFN